MIKSQKVLDTKKTEREKREATVISEKDNRIQNTGKRSHTTIELESPERELQVDPSHNISVTGNRCNPLERKKRKVRSATTNTIVQDNHGTKAGVPQGLTYLAGDGSSAKNPALANRYKTLDPKKLLAAGYKDDEELAVLRVHAQFVDDMLTCQCCYQSFNLGCEAAWRTEAWHCLKCSYVICARCHAQIKLKADDPKSAKCAKCQDTQPYERDRRSEELAMSVAEACPNREHGCLFVSPISDLPMHVAKCTFREFQIVACDGAAVGCPWKGSERNAKEHGARCLFSINKGTLDLVKERAVAIWESVSAVEHELKQQNELMRRDIDVREKLISCCREVGRHADAVEFSMTRPLSINAGAPWSPLLHDHHFARALIPDTKWLLSAALLDDAILRVELRFHTEGPKSEWRDKKLRVHGLVACRSIFFAGASQDSDKRLNARFDFVRTSLPLYDSKNVSKECIFALNVLEMETPMASRLDSASKLALSDKMATRRSEKNEKASHSAERLEELENLMARITNIALDFVIFVRADLF